MLGERIYNRIDKIYNGRVNPGKITGMLLEMDNADLLLALSDEALFMAKAEEAVAVLQQASNAPKKA